MDKSSLGSLVIFKTIWSPETKNFENFVLFNSQFHFTSQGVTNSEEGRNAVNISFWKVMKMF